ncbi:hypothetical protein D2N39_12735 [Gemmobacter lutimaris]|uniref:Peptidoglycan recognition protein family domain-containing protein n=1 Tax=Gemmobacter lutimaris TaxID=2306023 RepID=A0A398BRP0_9RHOB|nr:N-acetylmuramoyl-L-alanine amidase [Gemmobacter lutimaris]RID91561.1 hypothetical protein D2N39_12735 [Gemmobacter lutimaris]
MADENIRSIQTGLAGVGYSPGPIDGIDGPRTRATAVRWGQGAPVAARDVAPVTTSMIYQGSARYPVREVIVHCSATRPEWMDGDGIDAQVAEIRRWHKAQGWRDIGYHWVLGRSGELRAGRRETEIGAHVMGRNNGTIGICLIGGFGSAETDRPEVHFTDRQLVQLRNQIEAISMRTQITTVSGHNQYAAKACPGFHVPTWFKGA